MSWRYQILHHADPEYYALHEVYDDGASWTERPVTFVGDSKREVVKSLMMAIGDATAHPVKLVDE